MRCLDAWMRREASSRCLIVSLRTEFSLGMRQLYTLLSAEIWLEVVDWRFLKARGVPSQQDDTTSRRANAGGKETPRYAKTTPRRAAPRRTRPRSRRDRPSRSEEDAR